MTKVIAKIFDGDKEKDWNGFKPTLTPFAALQRLNREGDFTEGDWNYSLDNYTGKELAACASNKYEPQECWFTSGDVDDKVTEGSYWIC